MLDMLIWLGVVLLLFAIGDMIAKFTHARISSVFATLMLFFFFFVTGVLPSDIIDRAGLTAASSWSLPMLLFAMGSMINLLTCASSSTSGAPLSPAGWALLR